MNEKELASEASVLCTGIPLDVVKISDKHNKTIRGGMRGWKSRVHNH